MTRILLDTHPLIDFVGDTGAANDVDNILEIAKQGSVKAGISIATLAELCYIIVDEEAKDYAMGYFIDSNHLEKIAADMEIAIIAGELKRKYRVSLGDSIILATAIKNECDYVITNDPDMKKVTEIKIASPKEFLKEIKK